jgi:hypothetical protein
MTYFHEFWIYDTTIFFSQKTSCFLLKELQSVFLWKMISIEKFYLLLKENKENFSEKKNCAFVDSEFVKTCHEHVTSIYFQKIYWHPQKYLINEILPDSNIR